LPIYTDIAGLTPLDKGIEILGASSDHLMLDVEAKPNLQVGDLVSFGMNYSALLFSMSSIYVEKRFMESLQNF
ncbi:MAG: alanine racemase, partial [Caldisericia bacterium]|nr:alanine racemase [Caldisericia bacterium]